MAKWIEKCKKGILKNLISHIGSTVGGIVSYHKSRYHNIDQSLTGFAIVAPTEIIRKSGRHLEIDLFNFSASSSALVFISTLAAWPALCLSQDHTERGLVGCPRCRGNYFPAAITHSSIRFNFGLVGL